MEQSQLLPPYMSGFRPRRGAFDTLLELEHHLQEDFSRGHYTMVVLLDVEGAFNSASHNAILLKLNPRS